MISVDFQGLGKYQWTWHIRQRVVPDMRAHDMVVLKPICDIGQHASMQCSLACAVRLILLATFDLLKILTLIFIRIETSLVVE